MTLDYSESQLRDIWKHTNGDAIPEFEKFLGTLRLLENIRTGASTELPKSRAKPKCGNCGQEGHRAPQCAAPITHHVGAML